MHGSPSLLPPLHVLTHVDSAPKVDSHTVLVAQGTLPAPGPHFTADGHRHGPPNEYGDSFTASTTAEMSKALTFTFGSGAFGCK